MLIWILNIYRGIFIIRKAPNKYNNWIFYIPFPCVEQKYVWFYISGCGGGITYQFIQHDATRFFGFSSIWINQLEKAMVSDLESTIVDIATKPQLCGGIVEVGNTIFQAKARTNIPTR